MNIEMLDTLNLTSDEKDYLYNLGVQKCHIGDHKGAITIFQFLFALDAQNVLYGKALAGSMHSLNDYASANFFYNFVYQMQATRENYDCLFYSANCLLKLEQKETAKTNLEKFIELCNIDNIANMEYEKLLKKSQFLLKSFV